MNNWWIDLSVPEAVGKARAEGVSSVSDGARALHLVVDRLAGGAVAAGVVAVLTRVDALVAGADLAGLALGVGGAAGLAEAVDADASLTATVAVWGKKTQKISSALNICVIKVCEDVLLDYHLEGLLGILTSVSYPVTIS